MKKTILLNAIAPILLGAIIYYIFSPNVIFVKKIDEIFGFKFHIEVANTNIIWRFFRNHFLDMLWGYALVFALFYILDNDAAKLKVALIISFMTSCIMEVLQLFSIARGTFDLWDITWMLVAQGIAAFIIKKMLLRRKLS